MINTAGVDRLVVSSPAIVQVSHLSARLLMIQETRSLLTRIEKVKSFALYETMVPAAALSLAAQAAIERYLSQGRRELRQMGRAFLAWLSSPAGKAASPTELQSRFTILRMQFNLMLSNFDIFAGVVTQRSEHETGVWLSGLDVVAADALELPGVYQPPPVACYLDRGYGAAIRRARTRLPGGGENPIAVIRVPRERMVGSGVASSLVHETGHQAAASLGLLESLRPHLQAMTVELGPLGDPDGQSAAWRLWARWISEIVSDFWSVGRVGIGGTLGLMAVVSLPRAFVFRVSLDDPHPMPWIRVKLSCAMGKALYPDPQWDQFAGIWEQLYPLDNLEADKKLLLQQLENSIPSFVSLLVNNRPPVLGGRTLKEVLATPERQPTALRQRFQAWSSGQIDPRSDRPTLAFAVISQARMDGRLSPERESRMLSNLLTYWALRSSLDATEICTEQLSHPTPALVV